ncbi:hypothetical protein PILCRDRAFT_816843 [Piloderma croceum F 1598]|uniref:Uncharacterized protein n=1 Tax=Piloderma croceum (strain F 1598) TaxID=765440 RepID=A0A0C3C7L6_PILCF|nr:hypothetical protein PILCRDRAFT_816843 [Piloderma croceum F 1598]
MVGILAKRTTYVTTFVFELGILVAPNVHRNTTSLTLVWPRGQSSSRATDPRW